MPLDLSEVLFITTANELEPIPGPLRDRMEIIHLSGYTEQEKAEIARQYLVPRQIRENGLRRSEIAFDDEALLILIRDYTREAGVRSLEREIGRAARKVVTRIAEGEQDCVQIDETLLRELLGKPRHGWREEIAERTDKPGVATGLAWTPVGGEVLFVEAARMPGGKGFQYTGQLGEVMQESALTALSYIRSQAETLDIDPALFESNDIHLHVPAGAVRKDGPSAGVTMAVALASLLTGRPVRSEVAMTGELTLRGQVLPVGGIKDKVAGCTPSWSYDHHPAAQERERPRRPAGRGARVAGVRARRARRRRAGGGAGDGVTRRRVSQPGSSARPREVRSGRAASGLAARCARSASIACRSGRRRSPCR